ncbi:MAG: hypothetical protein O6850_04415 [Acidobacteria bacterium]|nr:hypothetical protein [Acidobacteriota bacterium]
MGIRVVCILALAALLPFPVAFAEEEGIGEKVSPEAKALVEEVVRKLGGEKFTAIESIAYKGRYFSIGRGGTAGFVPFESQAVYPAKRRFSYGNKKPIILINDGERGWRLDRLGRARQSADQIRAWRLRGRYNLYHLLGKVVNEPDILMIQAGSDFIDNVAVRVVEIMDTQQVQVKLYVDKERLLPVRISYRFRHAETKRWVEVAQTYGNFQMRGGVMTPLQEARWTNGRRTAEVFDDRILYNAPVKETAFLPQR